MTTEFTNFSDLILFPSYSEYIQVLLTASLCELIILNSVGDPLNCLMKGFEQFVIFLSYLSSPPENQMNTTFLTSLFAAVQASHLPLCTTCGKYFFLMGQKLFWALKIKNNIGNE